MIILIGGEKGGTGKSTLATNISVGLALRGLDVMLLDADPQATAARWVERRLESKLAPVIHTAQKTGDIYHTAKDLAGRYAAVVIDAGGRDSKELRTAMVAADTMFIPCKASQADLETMPHVDELIGLARGLNPALVATAILSMAPTNPQIREVEGAREFFSDFKNFAVCSCVVRERKPYRDAVLKGKGAQEMNDPKAKAEMIALINEILGA